MGVFNFKQFSICDDRAAMKVGTDAVVLGSWVHIEPASSILDIGTGSGIIALMLAQRSDPASHIVGVEVLPEDAQQATENVQNSPWPHKIDIVQFPIQDYDAGIRFDLIVSNPPFFSKSLLPSSNRRSTARHETSLSLTELLEATHRLLGDHGQFAVVLPFQVTETFIRQAVPYRLYPHRLTRFFSRKGKQQERSLIAFGRLPKSMIEDSLTLYNIGNQWSDEYRELTSSFYLD